LIAVPVTVVYDAEPLLMKTDLLHERTPLPYIGLNPADGKRLKLQNGDAFSMTLSKGWTVSGAVYMNDGIPKGVALLPRKLQVHGAPEAALVAAPGKLEKVKA